MARRIALGRKKKVEFIGGPFDGQVGYLHEPDSGTLEFTAKGMKGRYTKFLAGSQTWQESK